jgi:hypothetical protein
MIVFDMESTCESVGNIVANQHFDPQARSISETRTHSWTVVKGKDRVVVACEEAIVRLESMILGE